MEASLLQGSGEVTVPGAPDRKGRLDSRASQPAHPTPILRSGLPFTPGGGRPSSTGTWEGYSPFTGVGSSDYDLATSMLPCGPVSLVVALERADTVVQPAPVPRASASLQPVHYHAAE